jgi:NitT/TauT family transport system ATP-binding protein
MSAQSPISGADAGLKRAGSLPKGIPKLRLQQIEHDYVGSDGLRLNVLNDLSLDVMSGEFVTIVGGSGSGKTTLLRIIDHLIRPTRGSVLVDGKSVERPGGPISFVFQQDCLLPWRRVLSNAAYGLELRGISKPEANERARNYLKLVGLAGFEDYYPHQLSGGMRQRVNLARALTVEPDIMLMDEPFAALDAQTREMMQLELLRIWDETGKTVLFVTHQLDEAVFLADRVVALSARPGSIREVVDIDIPRPREIDAKRTERFQSYVGCLWHLIESDVRRGFSQQPKNV